MKVRVLAIAAVAIALSLSSVVSAPAAGKPVAPGNAEADKFLPAQSCGCHGQLIQQWEPSMHAKAIKDPVFLAKVAEAREQAGEDVAQFCQRCHSPIGNMLSEFGGSGQVSGEGVTCMFCHQVLDMAAGEPGNTSHLVQADLTRRAQIKDPGAPHPAMYSKLHESAEFCGGCHNVNHPVNGTHLESSYTEWKESPYAKAGIVCQDCHMSSAVGVVGPAKTSAAAGAPERDNIYSMTFIGANVGQGPKEQSTALLKSAAVIEVEAPEILAEGETASITVTITNKGAGHYLPTGLTEVREMWLTVFVEDEAGEQTKLGERRFGTKLKDVAGKAPAEVWAATGIESDDRIPPKKSVSESYQVTMPAGAKATAIKASLNYRSLPDDLATKGNVENPTTVMADAETTLYSSLEAKGAAASSAEEEPVSGAWGSSNWLLIAAAVASAVAIAAAGLWAWKRKK